MNKKSYCLSISYRLCAVMAMVASWLVACSTERPVSSTEPESLLEIPSAHQKKHIINSADADEEVMFFPAPDSSGKSRPDFSLATLGTKGIVIEALNLREDANNYIAQIQFTNQTTEGITSTLTIYAYDKNGRLLRSQVEDIFFRQENATIRQFFFSKTSGEVRWIFHLTGK